MERQEELLDEQVKKLENIAEREKRKRGKIQKIKEEIQSLEEKIANPPDLEDEAAIEADLTRARQDKNAVAAKWDDLQQRLREHADTTAGHKVELDTAEKECVRPLDSLMSSLAEILVKAQRTRKRVKSTSTAIARLRQGLRRNRAMVAQAGDSSSVQNGNR